MNFFFLFLFLTNEKFHHQNHKASKVTIMKTSQKFQSSGLMEPLIPFSYPIKSRLRLLCASNSIGLDICNLWHLLATNLYKSCSMSPSQ